MGSGRLGACRGGEAAEWRCLNYRDAQRAEPDRPGPLLHPAISIYNGRDGIAPSRPLCQPFCPKNEAVGRILPRSGAVRNQKLTASPLIVTLPKTAVALSLLLPLLTANPRQRVSGSPPPKLSVRTLPKVAPPSSE